MNDVTFAIKTFERPDHLKLLIESIKKFYPDAKIIVVDDSEKPIIREDVDEYYLLPFDVGISLGRNYLISKVKTKYVLLLDDDYIFTENTKIEKMLEILEKNDLDIIGGAVNEGGIILDYIAMLEREGDVIKYTKSGIENKGDYIKVDIMPIFFLSKTDISFDPILKVLEHFDFFWTLKQRGKKVGYTEKVSIDHSRNSFEMSAKYNEHRRKRRPNYINYLLEKYNIRELISSKDVLRKI